MRHQTHRAIAPPEKENTPDDTKKKTHVSKTRGEPTEDKEREKTKSKTSALKKQNQKQARSHERAQ